MNLATLISSTTVADVRAKWAGLADGVSLYISSWLKGGPGEQHFSLIAQVVFTYAGAMMPGIVRGQFIDLATDQGDGDGLPPAPGWLSAKGLNDYDTPRIDITFASGAVTLTNGSGSTYKIAPGALTFQRSTVDPATLTFPTYRNTPDPAVYVNPDGTVTLAPAGVLALQVEADVAGSASTAAATEVSILVTALLGVTVSNAAAIIGTDREPAPPYRERCKEQASSVSPNGPADAFRYIATSARSDGTYGKSQTGTPLGISKLQALMPTGDGAVTLYYASASGPALSADITIVNKLLTVTPGAISVPNAITFAGLNSTGVTVAVTYTAKATGSGVTSGAVQAAIQAALIAFFPTIPVGGWDQDGSGNGTLYQNKIKSVIENAHPAIYFASVSLPAADVSLLVGHVATLGTILYTVTIT